MENMRSTEGLRLLANINHRAGKLFEDGYALKRIDADTVEIENEEGTVYKVSTLFSHCNCPCWKKYETCKHLIGWKRLEETQEAYEAAQCAAGDLWTAEQANAEDAEWGCCPL